MRDLCSILEPHVVRVPSVQNRSGVCRQVCGPVLTGCLFRFVEEHPGGGLLLVLACSLAPYPWG